MKKYEIEIGEESKKIHKGNLKLGGANPSGDKISFTNYYMERKGEPFFGICGEFHYSRYEEKLWEDELIKMKMCGINIVATYIFWIHHEEEQGSFQWEGNKNLRKFIELCHKHGLYVIVRIGPFDHGEVRNGGIPDWLFGRPFEIRSNDEEYLFFVRKLYNEIGKQVKGLLYKEGGPVIGTQIENEYMHAGAPWELTTGTSNQWMSAGQGGEAHMRKLKEMALEAGIDTPIYTCTGWGGAAAPVGDMLPLWGGYAFWPWIFYGDVKEHPATPEYIFRDFHNNKIPKCYNFEPRYKPEDYPFACCEMGGGMTAFYKYRFILPFESVEAMTEIKVAGGCNFIGYYMFHGGSNPKGIHTPYLNEHATPKISYDFQAPLGEFGQVRESYHRIKLQHYFFRDFQKVLCNMKTTLPYDTENMDPNDVDTLRYCVRTEGKSGFLFINNYQDHAETKPQQDFFLQLKFNGEERRIPSKGGLSLAKDSCAILPFGLNLEGVKLEYSTTQLITKLEVEGESYYFFFMPEGMNGEYSLEAHTISGMYVENGSYEKEEDQYLIKIAENCRSRIQIDTKEGRRIHLCTVTRKESLKFWKTEIQGKERIILTDANVLVSGDRIKLECADQEKVEISIFPELEKNMEVTGGTLVRKDSKDIFAEYSIVVNRRSFAVDIRRIGENKAVLQFPKDTLEGVKELLLSTNYKGDIGYAFIDGELINDNFCNGAAWEIGLKRFEKKLLEKGMYMYISPLKKGSFIKSDSTMAARVEVAEEEIAEIEEIKLKPVYEVVLG